MHTRYGRSQRDKRHSTAIILGPDALHIGKRVLFFVEVLLAWFKGDEHDEYSLLEDKRKTNNGPQRWFKSRLWWTSNFNSNISLFLLPFPFVSRIIALFLHQQSRSLIFEDQLNINLHSNSNLGNKLSNGQVLYTPPMNKSSLPRSNHFSIFLRAESRYILATSISRFNFYLTDEIVPHTGISSLHTNNTNSPLKTYAVLGHYLGAWKRLPITCDHLRVDQPYIALSSLRWRKATRGWSYLYSIITTRIDHCLKPNVRPVLSKPVMPQSLLRKENYCRIIALNTLFAENPTGRWDTTTQLHTTKQLAIGIWRVSKNQFYRTQPAWIQDASS